MADAESPALSTRENDHDQWPMRCTSGCSRSGRGLPATRQLPPIDYCLNRWLALTRFLDDGDLPIETRWIIASSRLRAGGGTGCSSVH